MDLSVRNAYKVMIVFLESIYKKYPSDDLVDLLCDLPLLPDGDSADPAALRDWREAIKKVKSIAKDGLFSDLTLLNTDETYKSVSEFLRRYVSVTNSPNVEQILNNMDEGDNEELLRWWEKALELVRTNNKEVEDKVNFKLF